MMAIISILIVGLFVGFMMLVAASMLSSQISSTETELIINESTAQRRDPDSTVGELSP